MPEVIGTRNIFDLRVDLVQSTCGWAVPLMDFQMQREDLNDHWRKRGQDGLEASWKRNNLVSLDGRLTRLLED